jgi:hypothetical protein
MGFMIEPPDPDQVTVHVDEVVIGVEIALDDPGPVIVSEDVVVIRPDEVVIAPDVVLDRPE